MKKKNHYYRTIYRKLVQRYILSAVILLLIFVSRQLIIEHQVQNEKNISSVINFAGRQRMLSQKITKDMLIIQMFKNNTLAGDTIQDLKTSLELWKTSQAALVKRDRASDLEGNNSDTITAMLKDVEPSFENIVNAAGNYLAEIQMNDYDEGIENSEIHVVEQNEKIYLEKMNDIVNQYDTETRSAIVVINKTEIILFFIALLSLLFIAAFIFYPVSQALKSALLEVDQSNRNITMLFRSMRGALFIVKYSGEIIILNKDAERLIVNDKEQNEALYVDKDIKWKTHIIKSMLERVEGKGRVEDVETEVEDKSGNLIYVIVSAVEGVYEGDNVVLLSMYDITSQKQAEETLKNLAVRDKLTGLYNRTFVDTIIEEEINRAERYEIPLSAYILDLDFFKKINDTFGHPVGDTVLQQTAEILTKHTRISDYVIRIGGEEFIVLMPQTNIEGAFTAAEAIRQIIESSSHPIAGSFTASFGVVERCKGESYHSLYNRMDSALYEAKSSGRNRVVKSVYQGEGDSFVSLSWKAAWNCGEKILDEQHKELYRMLSRLVSSFMLPYEKETALARMQIIIEKLEQHFTYEEEVLENEEYEEAIKHKEIHLGLLNKTREIKESVASGEMEAYSAFIYLYDEVIINHLLREDVKYFPILSNDQMN